MEIMKVPWRVGPMAQTESSNGLSKLTVDCRVGNSRE